MNWEAIGAVSTAFTGLVIFITAVAALREVRIAAEHTRATTLQLEHLRSATQFEGALAVFSELDTPLQVEARHFVQYELWERLQDEAFRREVALVAGADERTHKELTVLRCFERVGMYAKKGFVDPDVTYMVASGRVIVMWRALEEVVAIHREIAGAPFWENFEHLYEACKGWHRDHGAKIEVLEAAQADALKKRAERAPV